MSHQRVASPVERLTPPAGAGLPRFESGGGASRTSTDNFVTEEVTRESEPDLGCCRSVCAARKSVVDTVPETPLTSFPLRDQSRSGAWERDGAVTGSGRSSGAERLREAVCRGGTPESGRGEWGDALSTAGDEVCMKHGSRSREGPVATTTGSDILRRASISTFAGVGYPSPCTGLRGTPQLFMPTHRATADA